MNPLDIIDSFAYYLPQFHTIPENDKWWGEGFTEWTQLRSARKFHCEQIIQTPGELGWYDLHNVEVIERQYELARSNGVGAFAFWHYWFGDGDLLLEGPAERLLASEVDARFCFAWANHDWLKRLTGEVLRRQTYSATAARHFGYLEPFFHDPRYVKIKGCPVMFLFSPSRHPNLPSFVEDMHDRAERSGFDGMYFIFDHTGPKDDCAQLCERYLSSSAPLKFASKLTRLFERITQKHRIAKGMPLVNRYENSVRHVSRLDMSDPRRIPVALPGWDTSIRHAERGQILLGNTPAAFGAMLDTLVENLERRFVYDRLLVFKSWNEWAEGNLIEPSAEYGRNFLQEIGRRFVLAKAGV